MQKLKSTNIILKNTYSFSTYVMGDGSHEDHTIGVLVKVVVTVLVLLLVRHGGQEAEGNDEKRTKVKKEILTTEK